MTADRIVDDFIEVSWNTPTGRVGCARFRRAELKRVELCADRRQVWAHARLASLRAKSIPE
jgi:hypothetical protein